MNTVNCGFCNKGRVNIPDDIYRALMEGEPIDCEIMCNDCEQL